MLSLTVNQTRLLRQRAQRLSTIEAGGPDSAVAVLRAVGAVQAQEMPAALLSVRARSKGLTAAKVEQARLEQRSIVRAWCLRGTLHLLAAEDLRWLLPLLGPYFSNGDSRRLKELGWDESAAKRGLELICEALAVDGPLTRAALARRLADASLPSEGQAPVHLLFRAALEGRIIHGPELDGSPAFVLWEDWLDPITPLPEAEALAELARRYLAAYGPAAPQDLAAWSGLPLGQARAAWRLIERELVPVQAAGQPAWMQKEGLEPGLAWLEERDPSRPDTRLLPKFDTYLLGYAVRDLALAPEHARRIHPGGGVIHAAISVDGRILGTWRSRRRKDCLEISIESFDPLPEVLLTGLEAEIEDIGRFLVMDSRRAAGD